MLARVWLTLVCLALGGCGISAKLDNLDTDGRARGVVESGGLAFVADGQRGLKIIDIRVTQPKLSGALDLPGFNSAVATDGTFALLNDHKSFSLYVVDVSDRKQPKLVATYKAPAPVRAVSVDDGLAVVIARSVDPTAPEAFDGLVAVSYGDGAPSTVAKIPLAGVADVGMRSSHVWAVTGERLVVFQRTTGGIAATPIADVKIAANAGLQSLDLRPEPFVVLLGKSLWVVDGTQPSAPKVCDHRVVSGNATGRAVTASETFTRTWSGHPWVQFVVPVTVSGFFVSYSTGDKYGEGYVQAPQGGIVALQLLYDVAKESKGAATLYDLTTPAGVDARLSAGGTAVLGALDNHGLAYERWQIIPIQP